MEEITEKKGKRRPITLEERQNIYLYYCSGATIREISNKYHRSEGIIDNILRLYGVKRRPHLTGDILREAVCLRYKGMSWTKISKALGFSSTSIITNVRKYYPGVK